MTGSFMSPNYPLAYSHRRQCEWRITVPTGYYITVTIPTFDLESHSNCAYDVLDIYGGPDDSAPRLAHLCHTQTTPQTLSSTGNTMFVRFRSDSSIAGTGFNASYVAVTGGCGGNFTTPSGTIVSKNYPSNYPHNTDCQWLITVAQDRVVEITFVDFDVETSSTCRFDYVGVYDGDSGNTTELARVCGRSLPSPVTYRSSSNMMYVRMRTDRSISARGFKANYITACGGVKNAETDGEIFTNNYPNNYERNSNCSWLIQADHNTDRITLTFTHMDVESADSCGRDYVKVLDGNDANAPEIGTYCGTTVPTTIRSQGSALFVIFISNRSFQRSGFRAVYTKSSSSCGGDFTSQSGSLTSPNYPNSYPMSTECVWTVRSSPGNSIMFAFSAFALQSSSNCNMDYVEMRSGGATGTLIGRFCGSTLPANITAVNSLWMKFRSDNLVSGTGFSGSFSSVFGGDISGTSGQISSPNYPGQYPHRVDYTWTVTTTVGMRIRVNFVAMDIEVSSSGNCYYDYVRLRDGNLATSPTLGRFCATTIPTPVLTTSNLLRVEFHTDFSASGTGFLLNWTATNQYPVSTPSPTGSTQAPGCGGSLVASGTPQTLTSPGFPSNYANNLNCLWTIATTLGSRIAVNITSIDLETHSACNYDFLKFVDSDTLFGTVLGTYCGRVPNADIVYSSRNIMMVQFRTDASATRTGFSMTYQTACGGVLPTATTGVIMSPNYPNNYPSNSNCSWSVKVLVGRTIAVTFNNSFNVPSTAACDTDYVMLLNGGNSESPPLGNGTNFGNQQGRYCGSIQPATLQTSSNRLFINFVSDGSINNIGFQLVYSEVTVTCGGSLTLTNAVRSGYIMSPNFPANYPHNVDCTWIITAPANERISVHYVEQFNIENNPRCVYDYVELRDGGSVTSSVIGQRACGNTLPSSQMSTGNVLFVRFRTDTSVTRVGFKARYEIATCGGRISGPNGTIESPNYPQNYDAGLDCEWMVTTVVGHYMTFTFTAFNVQSSRNCSADSLVIREQNSTGPVIFTGCGSRTIAPIDTSDSFAYFRFRTDSTGSASGFRVSFQASVETCGGALTTPTGVLTSPNYPGLYPHNRACEWTIQVQAGRKVTLTFTDFNLEASRTCSWDYIRVYNGILPNSPMIGRYCGTTPPSVVESSGSSMRIRFRTDGSVTNGGFRATYTSNNEADCGGVINGDTNITSPGYYENGNYTNKLECIWTINNMENTNSSIVVRVLDMDLEQHTTCAYDFLKIREGTSSNGPLLQQFCGNNTIRGPFITPVPSIWVRFKTDASIVGRGFLIDIKMSSCGGVLTQSTGVITSPNYPNNYDHNDACAWQILAPLATQIRLTFDNMSIENHPNCNYDYLKVFNGGYADSPLVGTYCTQQPPDFLSQSNSLRLEFKTDVSLSAQGFRVHYTFETGSCGGMFHGNTGSVTSPNYPSVYPHNVECVWDINVENGYTVVLNFSTPFLIESGNNCRYDYVELRDVMPNGTVISRGKYCGTNIPDMFTAMNNRMQVKFRSDSSVARTGFMANWTTSCGGTFMGDTGEIVSPGFPNNYDNNLQCNYTIITDPQRYVSLAFRPGFTLEGTQACRYDYVAVYGGNDTSGQNLGQFCGTTTPQVQTALGGMFVQFVTDRSLTFKGFRAVYQVQDCGGVLTGAYGRLSSILHQESYLNNHNCSWVITVGENRVAELKFNSFDLEAGSRCQYDYVAVYNGNSSSSPLLGRYCGTTAPPTLKATGRSLYVTFITDSSVTSGGFRAAYRETYGLAQGCGGTFNNTAGGTFTAVDIDNDGQYENGQVCSWLILMSSNKLATLNISGMDIETGRNCQWDSLKIYDGMSASDPMIGSYCGNSAPGMIMGSTNMLFVVFTADFSITGAGFNATYGQRDSICGGAFTATTSPQTITSPNYPLTAGQALRCRWYLDSSAGNKQVRLTLTAISLRTDSTCSQEYVEFRDSPLQPSGRNIHYCGSTLPASFDSAGRVVQVNYVIPDGSTSTGFSLTYQIATCDRNITGSSGRIVSPGWPGVYPRRSNCDIRLTTPPGTTISLYFTSMYIEPHSSCNFDYLQVNNGSSSGTMIAKLCGRVVPDPLFISNNQVYMNFVTDSSVQHPGYDISYTSTTQGLGCGGNLTGINGSLTSPGFPGNYSEVNTCAWSIQVPPQRRITLVFETFNVLGTADCANNYVAVYDGNSDSAQIFGRYCNEPSSQLLSTSNTAYVKLVSTGSAPAPSFRLLFNS